jgi:DNA-binding transcriptional LysR family regulator
MPAPPQSTLPNVLTFCAVIEQGSFSRAARQLGVTPQAASRSVVRLEETLGVTLFRRTTRTVTPTDAARAYYETAKQALALLQRAELEVTSRNVVRSGLVRLSVPTTYGHHRLLPALAAFRERYPAIELEIHVGNRNVDLPAEGYDLAVRLGVIRGKGLVARKLGDFPLGVYGAPGYLARRPAPRTPAQLGEHACIAFILPSTGRVMPWTFGSERASSFVPPAPLRCADDVLATITLARAGVGLVQTYDFLVEKDVERGLLVEVLRDFRGASRPFTLIYPATPKRSPAARALIEFLLRRPESAA